VYGDPVKVAGKDTPQVANPNSYAATSSSSSNVLKYRNRHTFRFDYTISYKVIEWNFNLQYNSYLENVDYAFVSPLFTGFEKGFNASPFSGLAEFRKRQENKAIKGDMILNTTFSWNITPKLKLGFLVKNLLNWEYTPRPGYYGEPRNYTMQFSYQFN